MVSTTVMTDDFHQIQTIPSRSSLYDSALLLLSSYMIAILLTTAVHELGHGMALASISINFRLVLNPFSQSMTMPLQTIPSTSLAFVASAGTIVELLFGTIVFVTLWRWRTPILVPLLMVAPVAYLSSAGYYLVGPAIPDGDTALMISMGVPAILVQVLGVLMLVFGVILMIQMFPLLGLSQADSFKRIFSVLFLGMVLHGFGMIAFALLFNPLELYIGIANVISMMVTILVLVAVFVRGGHFLERITHSEMTLLERTKILSIAGLALIFIVAELIFLN